jgi:hypothetical protein
MKIVLRRRYSTYPPGTEVDCDDDVARKLIADGVAESKDALPEAETATIDVVAERADLTPKRGSKPQKDH